MPFSRFLHRRSAPVPAPLRPEGAAALHALEETQEQIARDLAPVSEIDRMRLDGLRPPPVTIYLVDDCTPETIGVFTSFEIALEFADLNHGERIRVGELDSREWAEIKWERNNQTGQWERYQ